MKKKTFIIIGVIVLLILLFLDATKIEDATQTNVSKEQEEMRIGMVMNHASQDHYQESYYQIMKEYAKERGVDLMLLDAAGDAEEQKKQVQNLIDIECECIVIWPVNSEEAIVSAKAVSDAGIPCMSANTKISTQGEEYLTCHVGPSCFEQSQIVAEEMIKQLGEDIKIAEIRGPEGYASAEERSGGMLNVIAGTDVELLESQSSDGDRLKSHQIAEEYLAKYGVGEIDAIYTYDDNTAYGVWNALEEAGRQHDVKIYAVAVGKEESLDYVRDGKIAAAVIQSPYYDARDTLDMAIYLASGKKPEQFNNNIDTPLLTKDTVDRLHIEQW